jgi:hypothetical protein
MMDRRQLLFGGLMTLTDSHQPVAATSSHDARLDALLERLTKRLPRYEHFLTLAEVRRRMQAAVERYPRVVTVQQVGTSRGGEPIEMLTVHGGPRSALLVAGVHANEVVGSLTADFLVDALAADADLRDGLGYTWHVINPVDPDGLKLNDGWLSGPLSPETYFRHFARPALGRQPDYGFPLKAGSFEFSGSSPENSAFQVALDLTRPDFLYTLHNAEYGGAFFLTSRPKPRLETRLQATPGRFGVLLDSQGEPLTELAKRANGVYGLPTPTAWVQEAVAAGKDAASVWPAGAASTEYAERFGTFALAAEVPYWADPRVFDATPTRETLPDILQASVGWLESGAPILQRWSGSLKPSRSAVPELVYALREMINGQLGQPERLRRLLATGRVPAGTLSRADALRYRVVLHMVMLRPFALLSRVAREGSPPLPPEAGRMAWDFLTHHLSSIEAETTFERIPIRSLVGIQAVAGVIASQAAAGS